MSFLLLKLVSSASIDAVVQSDIFMREPVRGRQMQSLTGVEP